MDTNRKVCLTGEACSFDKDKNPLTDALVRMIGTSDFDDAILRTEFVAKVLIK